jgi:SEC-C motif-containing protein
MRSRYTAYNKIKVDYLVETTHPSRRSDFEPSSIREWATENNWIKLEVLSTKNGKSTDTQGEVEFRASLKMLMELLARITNIQVL